MIYANPLYTARSFTPNLAITSRHVELTRKNMTSRSRNKV